MKTHTHSYSNGVSALVLALALPLAIPLTACNSGGSGASVSQDNQPPVISGEAQAAVKSAYDYAFQPTFSDADADTPVFDIVNKPHWASFDPETGLLSGTPGETDVGEYRDIVISVSDGQSRVSLEAFDIHVLVGHIGREHIHIDGQMTEALPVTDGASSAMAVQGTTVFTLGARQQTLEESELAMEFDDEGKLVHMSGETRLPARLSDDLAINSESRARVGMYKGSEINADPVFGITLKDDFDYLVFYLGTSTDIEVGAEDRTQITLEPPLSGEVIFISDPTDPFYYYYANIPFVGEAGHGNSLFGFIPFEPGEDFAELDVFDGHIIDKGSFGIGIKAVDLFNFEGTRVTRMPVPGDIDWEHAMDSKLNFKSGLNGAAQFALSVFSVGLFEFDLASASATLDMGLQGQHFALQGTIAPDVSWQPDWFAILPEGELQHSLVVDGDSGFEARINGSFRSTLPEAELNGSMVLNQNSARFSAQIPNDRMPLAISAEFANEETRVEISAPVDVSGAITDSVNQQLDRELAQLEQTLNDLTDAIADYEFEVSLRGVRQSLPPMMDNTIAGIDSLPSTVYSTVYNRVKSGIEGACYSHTVNYLVGSHTYTYCAADYVDEVAIARSSASDARDEARDQVNAIIPLLQALKTRAQQADDEQLREALRSALWAVYEHRSISVNVNRTITIPLPWPIGDRDYTIDRTETVQVLSDSQASTIRTAAENAHRIQETSDQMFSLQNIVDELPTEAAINQARERVDQGLAQIPSFQGAGYVVSQGNVLSYIILDNERIGVEANVLNPVELMDAIAREVSRRVKTEGVN